MLSQSTMRFVKIILFLSLWSVTSADLDANDETWAMEIKKLLDKFPVPGLHSRMAETSDNDLKKMAYWIVNATKNLLKAPAKNNKYEDEKTSMMLAGLMYTTELPEEVGLEEVTKDKYEDEKTSMMLAGLKYTTELPEEVGLEEVTKGPRNDDTKSKLLPSRTTNKKQYSETTTNLLTEDNDDSEISDMLKNMVANPSLLGEDVSDSNKATDSDAQILDFLNASGFRAPGLDHEASAKDNAAVSVPLYVLGRDI